MLRSAISASVILVLFLSSTGAAQFHERNVDNLSITVKTGMPPHSHNAYTAITVNLTNSGDDRRIRLVLRPSRGTVSNWAGGAQTVTRELSLRKGETATAPLFLVTSSSAQYGGYYSGKLMVYSNGSLIVDDIRCDLNTRGDTRTWLLVADTINTSAFQRAATGGKVSVEWTLQTPTGLPEHWLALSCYDVIYLSHATLTHLAPGQKEALAAYVQCGGNLLIGAAPADPVGEISKALFGKKQALQSTQGPAEERGAPTGDGRPWRDLGSRSSFTELEVARTLLGRIYWTRNDPFPGKPGKWETRLWGMGRFQQPSLWFIRAPVTDANRLEQIPGVGEPPIVAYMGITVLFAILIGPLNYILLRRARKLPLLVVTVPGFAILTTIVLLASSVFSEGLGVKARILSATFLDQRANRVFTAAKITYYAGLAPRSGLNFSADTFVSPVGTSEMDNVTATTTTTDWSNGQTLSGGWVPSRTQIAFTTVRARPENTGKGLRIKQDADGTVSVINALQMDLQHLLVKTSDGSMHYTQRLKKDGTAVTSKVQNAHGSDKRLTDVLWPLTLKAPKQSFIALTDDNGFVEPGVEGLQEIGSEKIISGIY